MTVTGRILLDLMQITVCRLPDNFDLNHGRTGGIPQTQLNQLLINIYVVNIIFKDSGFTGNQSQWRQLEGEATPTY